jgi:hypothetical protein
MRRRYTDLLPLALLVALSCALLVSGLTRGHAWGGDFSQYILQAISLVEGRPQAFVDANRFTMEQSSRAVGPIAYPWGVPLLLAPIYARVGLDVLAMKAVNVVAFLAFLGVLWAHLRRRHSTLGTLACTGLFALNPHLLLANDHIGSDIPFLLLSMLSMVLIGAVIVEQRRLVSPAFDRVLVGAAMAAAFFVRTNGILLPATLAISQAVAARRAAADAGGKPRVRRAISALLPHATFALIVTVWTVVLPEGGASYADHLRQITPLRLYRHLHYYSEVTAAFFEGVPHHQVLYGATLPLALVGMLRRARSDYHVVVYTVLTLGLYVAWPETQGLRFIFPILPFYVSFVVGALVEPGGAVTPAEGSRWRRAMALAPVVIVLLYFGKTSATHAVDNLSRDRASLAGPFLPTSQEMFSFVRAHTPPRSTIIFFKPRVLRLFTGRNAIMIYRPDQLGRGDYLCYFRSDTELGQLRRHEIDRLVTAGQLALVYSNDHFELYRLNAARS